MIETILPAEMKALEESFMRERGIPSVLLMEKAAEAVADALADLCAQGSTVLFLCGPGSNGGDGYAASRIWAARGGRSLVWEISKTPWGDAGLNRALAVDAEVRIRCPEEVPARLPHVGAVVDALFGTGLSRAPEGICAGLIRLVNASGVPVLAVDIPSGLDGETGIAPGDAIRADVTVTFHRVKAGLLLRDGCAYTGELRCAPILIPDAWGETGGLSVLAEKDIASLLPVRSATGHKGSNGRCVLLVGSKGMAGAASLAASACIRAGAGTVTVLCREAVLPFLQTLVPGAVCRVLPEIENRLAPEAANIAADALSRADAACVGCGIGLTEDLLPLLAVFRNAECPVVWDADALTLLAAHTDLLPLPAKDAVTPHPGEAARLLDSPVSAILGNPLKCLDALYGRVGCRVILKGARSLMRDGVRRAVNPIGTPALAKAGSGDVLSGILTALQARMPADLLPLQLACYLHAKAGQRAAAERGVDGTAPQDVADAIRFQT
ncbi:MAG: NAD(P)H-hydrate dehydratase [Clostridia bacterium]|nr:NAD(P)H-hydrate dehydratase [Clostridia bacterium]